MTSSFAALPSPRADLTSSSSNVRRNDRSRGDRLRVKYQRAQRVRFAPRHGDCHSRERNAVPTLPRKMSVGAYTDVHGHDSTPTIAGRATETEHCRGGRVGHGPD